MDRENLSRTASISIPSSAAIIISSIILMFGLISLGKSIERAGYNSRPDIRIPSNLSISAYSLAESIKKAGENLKISIRIPREINLKHDNAQSKKFEVKIENKKVK